MAPTPNTQPERAKTTARAFATMAYCDLTDRMWPHSRSGLDCPGIVGGLLRQEGAGFFIQLEDGATFRVTVTRCNPLVLDRASQ